MKEVADERSWQWLSGGYMAVGTERYIFAAQEQALGTRWARNTRYKEEVDPMCRVCGKQLETVNLLASACGELAKKQYVTRHDRMGRRVTGSCVGSMGSSVRVGGMSTFPIVSPQTKTTKW